MDKEKIKLLINLTVLDNNYRLNLLKKLENEEWIDFRIIIEDMLDGYDILNTSTDISGQLIKAKIQLYKITQNLYSEFMLLYNEFLDKEKIDGKISISR